MKFFKGFLLALIGSVVVNLIILFLLKPFVINPVMPLHALSVMPVVMLTTIGVFGATVVYALMRQFLARPNMPYIWLSAAVLLVSFIPDYQVIGVTTGAFAGGTVASALTLALMHVFAAVIIVGSLTKLWGPRTMRVATNQ